MLLKETEPNYPKKKGKGIMPKVVESLIVPIVLPVWSIICAVVVGAFGFGINYNQLSTLVENQKKVDLIYERQITMAAMVQQLDNRVTALERK